MVKKYPYKEIVLPNKLKLLLYPMESVLSVHLVTFVRVGAVYEKEKERGISHFTEHMPFLGTKKFQGPLALSRQELKIGAKDNGWTDRFNTRYFVILPYLNIAKGIELLYQLVFKPLLKKSDVEKEKGVILSEFNDFWHNPDLRFNYETWRKRFKQKKHPYSYRAVGIPDTINSITQKDILSWREKYYNPSNMILSIVGKFDENKTIKIIENTFAKENAGLKAKEPKFNTKDYSNFLVFRQKEPRQQIKFFISFPAFGRKEISRTKRIQLHLLNHIFGEGSASRLFQTLREKERLVYRIGSDLHLHTWMGALEIWGSTPIQKLLPAMKLIKQEIDKIVEDGVSQKEIKLSRNYINAITLMRFDNPESITYYFGYQAFDEEEIWFPEDYTREANKITKNELDELAREIIDYKKVNISLMGNVPQKTLKSVENIFK